MHDDKEIISAFLDDGLGKDEVGQLTDESGATRRYQLIGEALRGKPDDVAMIDISAAVMQAITQDEPDQKSNVAELSDYRVKRQSPEKPAPNWLKPVAGLAVAASVALVMVVTVIQVEDNSAPGVGAGRLADNTPVLRQSNIRPVVSQVNRAADLENYLEAHSESSGHEVMQGRIPFVRAATYESN